MHTDTTLEINSGDINITKSYEGIESAIITINGGNIHITSSDDGLNVAGGNDGSGMMMGPGRGGGGRGQGGMPGQPGGQVQSSDASDQAGGDLQPSGMMGQDGFATSGGSYYLHINGGYIVVDAAGDGLDSNGSIEMTDGVVIVNGPTENMNGALDCMGSFKSQVASWWQWAALAWPKLLMNHRLNTRCC
jgi:hypothetical protein